MMTQSGVVKALKSDSILVEIKTCHQACGNCQCGARFSILSILNFTAKSNVHLISAIIPPSFNIKQYPHCENRLTIGDKVLIGFSQKQLLVAAVIHYLFPLLMIIIWALVADMIWPLNENMVILAAIVGLFIAFFLNHNFHKNKLFFKLFSPVLIKRTENLKQSGDAIPERSSYINDKQDNILKA